MQSLRKFSLLEYAIMWVWVCNCILWVTIAVRESWIPYMDAGSDSYQHIQSDPFDGTSIPVTYIPDWTKTAYQNKGMRFEEIPISDYIPTPLYDPVSLTDINNSSKTSQIIHYTYITPYMGSYRLNYKENDGSHLWVDIRAPIWTPVLAIANGVVVRTIEADLTGNKFVVLRHDNVPWNGKTTTLYSWYLHLSQINVTEGTKIRKGEMLGRVGMTGLATTPHLHIQVDLPDAPFHPYWPFNSSDSTKAGFWFYDSVNAWVGKEKALLYSIHPMRFINSYLGGVSQAGLWESSYNQSSPTTSSYTENNSEQASREALLWSYIATPALSCQKYRFPDVSERSALGKLLYPLVDEKCLFQEMKTFNTKEVITKRDALMLIMDYYKIPPTWWTSHFLDIPIWDAFQGYALVAYRRWVIDGNYAHPEKILSKEEFAELITKIGKIEQNPSQIKVYNDVDSMSLYFNSIQNYGFLVKARWGKFYPKTILTRWIAVQMLASIYKQERQKK